MKFKFANVLMLLASTMVISVNAQAFDFSTLSPTVQFSQNTVKDARLSLMAKSWKVCDAELPVQALRVKYSARTGISEATFMMSILNGLPQNFWGNYLDWRDYSHAFKAYSYLVETCGFDPKVIGIAEIQDGYGVNSGFHQQFRMYFPCITLNGKTTIMLDRDYLESVGVPPETTRLVVYTDVVGSWGFSKEQTLNPWPKVSIATAATVATPVVPVPVTIMTTPDCGCDNHRGNGNSHCDNGKQTVDQRGNSSH